MFFFFFLDSAPLISGNDNEEVILYASPSLGLVISGNAEAGHA